MAAVSPPLVPRLHLPLQKPYKLERDSVWAAATHPQQFCAGSPCLSLNTNRDSRAGAAQRGGQSPPHPEGPQTYPQRTEPAPWGCLLLSPKSWPIPLLLTPCFPRWGRSEASSGSAAAWWLGAVLSLEVHLPQAGREPCCPWIIRCGGSGSPFPAGVLRGVTAGCLYKPTGTSPASDTSLPAAPGCNPPRSSDVTGGGRVQPPPSPFGDSKCLILRGSQTNKCNFSHFGAWPAAPLGALPTAAPRSLPPSRVRLCRQTSHLCQIFHPKMSLFPPCRMTRRRRSYGAQLTVLTHQVPLPGRAMLSAALGTVPHTVPQQRPVPSSHASIPVVPEAFVDALQAFQGRWVREEKQTPCA